MLDDASPPIAPQTSAADPAFGADLELEGREPALPIAASVRAFLDAGRPDVRALVRVGDLAEALAPREPAGPFAALAADVAALARAYARRVGAPEVEVRLERIEDDACRAFHRDHVRLRLMTTYAGPGTEFVEAGHAQAALADPCGYAGPVRSMPAGAVGWVAGAEAGPGRGLVHRSPPLAGRGLVRLFLAVNTPLASSPPLWTAADGALIA